MTSADGDTLFESEIGRGGRNLLRLAALISLLTALAAARYHRAVYNWLAGPFPIEQLRQEDDDLDGYCYFAATPAGEPHRTGIWLRRAGPRKTLSIAPPGAANAFEVVLLEIPGRGDIAVATREASARTYAGRLTDYPPRLARTLTAGLSLKGRKRSEGLYPRLLVDAEFERLGALLILLMAIAAALALAVGALGGSRRLWPRSSRDYRQLVRYGEPDEVAAHIDRAVRLRSDRILVGEEWLLCRTRFGVEVIATDEVIWYYPLPAFRGASGLALYERGGHMVRARGSVRRIERVQELLEERVPWALHRHDPELVQTWRRQRELVVELADERRRELHNAEDPLVARAALLPSRTPLAPSLVKDRAAQEQPSLPERLAGFFLARTWLLLLAGGVSALTVGVSVVRLVESGALDAPPGAASEADSAAAGEEGDDGAEVGWREVRSRAGRFAVLLPGEPVLEGGEAQTPIGTMETQVHIVRREDGAYAISHYDLPGALLGADPRRLLGSHQQSLLRALEASAVEVIETRVGSFPARRIQARPKRPQEGHLDVMLVAGGNRLYELLVFQADERDAELVDRIFLSFRLL